MNSDQIKGKANQVVGKAKQGVGKVTGNERMVDQGVIDQIGGTAQETWGNVKDAAHEAVKTHDTEHQHKSTEMRDNVANKVEDTGNRANQKIDEFKDRQRQRRSA